MGVLLLRALASAGMCYRVVAYQWVYTSEYRHHIQALLFSPEDRYDRFLRNVSRLSHDYKDVTFQKTEVFKCRVVSDMKCSDR
jgi:hypothetical protein